MVLEHLFPEDWLEKKLRYAFLLALVYSTVAIVMARLLFPKNSGIVSLVFVSLLLMPYLEDLLVEEEKKELKEKTFRLRELLRDTQDAVKVYAVLFFGIYLAYAFYSFLLPQFGVPVSKVFQEQISLETNLRGDAFSWGTFTSIFLNNWWVLLACFLVALVAGDGALFFVAWNASSWGTIFGFRALEAGAGAYGAWANLAIILVITLPHVILEGGAYVLAAIAGGVLSDDVTSKRSAMSKFIYYFIAACLLFVVLHALLKVVFAQWPIVARLLDILLVLCLLHFLAYVFDDKRHKEVFLYNYALFLVAILLFVLGAIVETFVLRSSGLLANVYWAAML